MIRTFFKYDFIRLLRDKIILFLLVLIFLLVGVSIYNGSNWINFQRENIGKINATRQIQYDTHIKDGEKYDQKHDTIAFDSPNNPLVIYWGLRGYAYKNPVSAGTFCIGQSDLFPYYSMLVGVDKQYLIVEEEIQNPLNQFIGKLDLSFCIVYLLPIFIILLCFDALSSEKELGTIRLVQTQGISPIKIVTYKITLRFLLISSCTILSILFWLLIFESGIFSMLQVSTLLICLLLIILYILFWCVLSFLICSLGRNSVVNSMILISCWIGFLFIIPTTINTIAEMKYPVPSRNEQVLEDREKENYTEAHGTELLKKYLQLHPEHQAMYADTSGRVSWMDWYFGMLANQVELDKELLPGEVAIRDATFKQQSFCDGFRFFSPSLLMTHTLLHASETSVYDQLDYAGSLDIFNAKWRAFDRDKIFRRAKFTNEDFYQLPQFSILKIYNVFSSLKSYLTDAVSLLFFSVLFALVALYNFTLAARNLDV